MLDTLNDQTVGKYLLRVEDVGRTRYFDQRDFALTLIDSHANKIQIFRGLYNAGRPSIYVPGWIDGEFIESPSRTFPLTRGERGGGALYEEVARKIGALIPPGGRLWLAYEAFGAEGAMMLETRVGLQASLPMVTTPIGFLLYCADCWLGLRDWHFPEGGREGPRKLQGNKAVSDAHRRERAAEIAQELNNFIGVGVRNQIERQAQRRARIILPAMNSILK